MTAVAVRGDADELSRFRRLVTVTIVATFALILIGGVVRVSDSGLGCGAAGSGTHGWPLCEGGVLPADSAESVIEFSHRIAATVVTVLIALLALKAFRRLREHRLLVRGSIAAGLLVLAQAALGGLTVEQGLEDELVAAHLGLAMLLLGLLFVLRRGAETTSAPAQAAVRGLRPLGIVTSVLVLATIVAGGYVAGTEYHGTEASRWSARTRPAAPAGAALSSRAATARGRSRSASRGSPTSSSPTGCSCTWPRSRCSRWRRWRCAAAPRAGHSGSRR